MIENIVEIFLLSSTRFIKYKEYWVEKLAGDISQTILLMVISPIYQKLVSVKTLNNYLLVRDTVDRDMSFKELLLAVRTSTRRPITAARVSGDHFSIFEMPAVETLAEIFDNHIKRTCTIL